MNLTAEKIIDKKIQDCILVPGDKKAKGVSDGMKKGRGILVSIDVDTRAQAIQDEMNTYKKAHGLAKHGVLTDDYEKGYVFGLFECYYVATKHLK